jgi:hypothetical protein
MTSSNEITYLACPYSDPDPVVREQRFEQATRFAAELTAEGRVVFSPVTHNHPLVSLGMRHGWDAWRNTDLTYLRLCQRLAVLCLPGWWQSTGVPAEIQFMQRRRRPVEYCWPEWLIRPGISDWLCQLSHLAECCWVCGWSSTTTAWQDRLRRGLDVHHITRGVHRAKGHDDPAALMLVCAECHHGVVDSMSVPSQLALKRHYDPQWYDRVRVNVLRRRQPNAITEAEVEREWQGWLHRRPELGKDLLQCHGTRT